MMEERARASSGSGEGSPYAILIHGELDGRWAEWFDGVQITVERAPGRPPLTTLHCPAMDQAKLRGLLNKIWDMNLKLISVHQVRTGESAIEAP